MKGIHEIAINVLPDIDAPTCRITGPQSGIEILETETVKVSVATQDNFRHFRSRDSLGWTTVLAADNLIESKY